VDIVPINRLVNLNEQLDSEVLLTLDEASYLADELGFDVFPSKVGAETNPSVDSPLTSYRVNPKQYVGHFSLSTGASVVIRPKIPAASVFRMLAYVYVSADRHLLDKADVLYASDTLLFEPLVELFNELVAKRVREGLAQDYIRREENLRVLKGKFLLAEQLRRNRCRPDHLMCRYFGNTADIEDNQIIKWTLWKLPTASLTELTVRNTRANLHQFEAVSLVRPQRTAFDRRHYHRLNDGYRLLHGLCRLFLDGLSVSENRGDVKFRGYLLDMNSLFERFVTQAFMACPSANEFAIIAQEDSELSDAMSTQSVCICPDVLARRGDQVVAVIDAKYKKITGAYKNHDIYQMISYGTGLGCSSAYLYYPSTESEFQGSIFVTNSGITIEIKSIDIESKRCVDLAEASANELLLQHSARRVSVANFSI
jgi:5-methylcytosine-specific restriction enzyme subunit McrC